MHHDVEYSPQKCNCRHCKNERLTRDVSRNMEKNEQDPWHEIFVAIGLCLFLSAIFWIALWWSLHVLRNVFPSL